MPLSRFRSRRRPYTPRKRRYRRTTLTTKRRYKPRMTRAVGLPKQIYTKLRYSELVQYSVAGAAFNGTEYRLNSIYDPAVALGGGQPYYADQYAAMFNRYRVYGCKVEVMMSCTSSSLTAYHPTAILVRYSDTTPSWSNFITASNAKGTIRRTLIPGQTITQMKAYYNLPSVAGVSRREYNDTEVYQAVTSANPTRAINCSVLVQNNDPTNAVSVQFTIRLTYYLKYFDNLEPAPS